MKTPRNTRLISVFAGAAMTATPLNARLACSTTAVVLCLSILGASLGHAQTSTPSVATDTVESVTIQGTKNRSPIRGAVLPKADAPKSATCEYYAATDPTLRAQIGAAEGDPIMGPTFYQPTRESRNPDYKAPPLKAPGSELPAVKSMWKGGEITTQAMLSTQGSPSVDAELKAAFSGCGMSAYGSSVSRTSMSDGPTDSGSGGGGSNGRLETAYRDTTLRMGSALFDEGRYEESLTYYKKAYEKLDDLMGGDEAMLMIGKIYLLALGEKSDSKEAVVWLKRAANVRFKASAHMPQFNPRKPDLNTASGEASVILGNLYLKGTEGVAADPKEARKWFDRARYVGHVPAAKVLGDMNYYGIGGAKDEKRAFDYYKEAATLGYMPAQVILAGMYAAGEGGVAPDMSKALAWYEQAAKLEHPGAIYILARAYDLGQGAPADPQKAIRYYKVSALKGNIDAQTAMATYFYEGKLVPKDDATARQWFQTAAIGGDADAMFNLGVMTMKGEGGEADLTKAWVWFKMSETGGVEAAPAAVAAVEKRMSPQQLETAKGIYSPAKS